MCSVQAFLPAVVLRQQAFKSLQEQSGAVKQLQVPAAWHVGVSNAVSLAVGACKALCMLLSVLFAAVAAAGSRMLNLNDRNSCENTGPSDLAEATFSMPIVQEQKELHECCFGDSALELAQHLTAAVESGLNVRAPASMQQVSILVTAAVIRAAVSSQLQARFLSLSCVCADLLSVLPQQCCTAALSSGCARSICAADTLVCQESMPSATFSVLARRSAAGHGQGITEWTVVHGPGSQLAAAACR